MSACDHCLRRAWLLGEIAPLIRGQPATGAGAGEVSALPDCVLIAEFGRGRPLRAEHARFSPGDAREHVRQAGLTSTCRHRDLWPGPLAELDRQEPAALFSTCDAARLAELLSVPVVTIVGSRSATPYGLDVATAIGRDLAVAGVTVVSGLALGIDAAAHRGALAGRGCPVAVLAGGADVPYPRRHTALHGSVAEAGAVVSEIPPGRRPYRWGFPARNRIMAALAGMTVVVEAREPSGSLITVHDALRLGRSVGAVPGPVTSRQSDGPNGLLADGAVVVRGAKEILDAVHGVENWPEVVVPPRLTALEQAVLSAVEGGLGAAELASREAISPPDVRAALARLELAGLITSDGLGQYRCVAYRPARRA